jgi:hypothetical protein
MPVTSFEKYDFLVTQVAVDQHLPTLLCQPSLPNLIKRLVDNQGDQMVL